MSETPNEAEQIVDLRTKPALREVGVREGVVLRPMQDKHAPGILRVLGADSSIRDRVTVASRMETEEDVHREVAAYQESDDHIRYVIEKEGEVVGLVSLWRDTGFFGQVPKPHAFGFGFFLDPAERGQHLTTDSVRALMKTAQDNFRVDTFMAFCEDNNTDSIHALDSLGFTPTETLLSEPTKGWQERLYEKEVANG